MAMTKEERDSAEKYIRDYERRIISLKLASSLGLSKAQQTELQELQHEVYLLKRQLSGIAVERPVGVKVVW